jgi:hypothetical protein
MCRRRIKALEEQHGFRRHSLDLRARLLRGLLRGLVGHARATHAAEAGSAGAKWLGLAGVTLASVNIFGGFAVTARMLAMYRRKERPSAKAPAKGERA